MLTRLEMDDFHPDYNIHQTEVPVTPAAPLTNLLALGKETEISPESIVLPNAIHLEGHRLLNMSLKEHREYATAFKWVTDVWRQSDISYGNTADYSDPNEVSITAFKNEEDTEKLLSIGVPDVFLHTHPLFSDEEKKLFMENRFALSTKYTGLKKSAAHTFERYAQAVDSETALPSRGDLQTFLRLRSNLPIFLIYAATGITLLAANNEAVDNRGELGELSDQFNLRAYQMHLFNGIFAENSDEHRYNVLRDAANILSDRGVIYFSPDSQSPQLGKISRPIK